MSVKFRLQFFSKFRSVATWSPLGAALNTLPAKKLNLSFKEEPGLFGVPALRSYEGFYFLKETACERARALVNEACDSKRTRLLVDTFDELSDTLCQVADLAEFVRVAHPRAAFRTAAEDVTSHIASLVEQLNTHLELYEALKEVYQKGDRFPTTPEDRHMAELFLFDFEQSGIHLSEEARKKVVKLTEAILHVGHLFIEGCHQPRSVSVDEIPAKLRAICSTEGLGTNCVLVHTLHADNADEEVREAAYRIYLRPDPHQEELLRQMLHGRLLLARTCGFQSFAHRAIRGTLAETPEFVIEFLSTLNTKLRRFVNADLAYLQQMKDQLSTNSKSKVQPWDISYLSGLLKSRVLSEANSVEEYFCLGACMEGLSHLTQKLFGVNLSPVEPQSGEIWSSDVYKLAVEDEQHGLLGHIYLDLYRRTGKPLQDCHFTIRGGRQLPDGSYQTPIVVLMLNLEAPRWSRPCLLTVSQLDNLSHEMGHALHSMLGRTRHQHVAGTRCSTDFAEVPSILMEYFLTDPRVLRSFGKHFQTRDLLKEDTVKTICAAKRVLMAVETQTQILYSALDQHLHGPEPIKTSTTDIFCELHNKYSILPAVANTGWQLRFSHLVGYGARYYAYLLSRSVASSIWQAYFQEDPFSRSAGEKYREECLKHGGGRPPRQIVQDYLGREVTPSSMAQALITEIEKAALC